MDDVVEISLENACRLCLNTDQIRSSIFGVPHVSVPFADKIRACLSIQVLPNDKVSTQVCTSCIKNVNNWHSYKDSCLRAQERLQQWLAKNFGPIPPIVNIKEEPMDVEFPENNAPTVSNQANSANQTASNDESVHAENDIESTAKPTERQDGEISPGIHIKAEPIDTEDEDDFNVDIESVNSGELLINPMAVAAGNTANSDRIMEADSTQKFAAQKLRRKKKFRRGPHTHFRGTRVFKKKCPDCQIFLHSKFTYTQHMSRYHGIHSKTTEAAPIPVNRQKSKLTEHVDNIEPIAEAEIQLSPEEVQFEKMIKTDPLTPVQKNIIGQLKTFSCFSCKQTFLDRRHTLNHIRVHMPDLRPYTCIACLTEFSDRSMYKLHCGASFECAMKIALVVPRVGSEKYFTCNMCLKPFNNRSELLNHLAEHAEKQHKQLNEPLRPPPKLKPIAQQAAAQVPKQAEFSPASKKSTAGPYMNGDPAHNHMCNLCGMIYRYKPNMFKHRDLCATLPANIRTSYRCFHCSMTYLVYKKFYTHIFSEHKKREITCYTCHMKFATADEYLTHHETHRDVPIEGDNQVGTEQQPESSYPANPDPMNTSTHPTDVGEKPFNCALCGENFATKVELSEHRNLHLKVKIYSCVICRSMFSSSGALEVHMKDHGIQDANEQNANSSCVEYKSENILNQSMSAVSDPGGKFNHCYECNKNFSNYANLKRHERNLHGGKQRRRWSCDDCKRRFKTLDAYNEHVATAHGHSQPQSSSQSYVQAPLPLQSEKLLSSPPKISATTGKPLMQCPKCPKMFAYQGNLIQHCQNVHKENHFERIIATARAVSSARSPAPRPVKRPQTLTSRGHTCDICGKSFREEQSLKVHRGWHLRTNYRLKKDQNASMDESMLSGPGYTITPLAASPPKPAKARKSFPNNPSQKQLNAVGSLQCQVCADRFTDVAELRKHLWDVHCARNKPEKSFTTSDLQCELCTNKFPDDEALKNHMKWHQQNPILGGYHNGNDLNRIETVDETNKPFYCETCGKYYSNRKVFLRHKKLHKVLPVATMMNLQSLQSRRNCYCNTCQKNFATEASLRRHKASQSHLNVVRSQIPAKKITTTALIHHPPPDPLKNQEVKDEPNTDYSDASSSNFMSRKKSVTCSDCKQAFPNMSVLYQHRQLVHKVPMATKVLKPSGGKPTECVPLVSTEGFVCCNVCGKQFPGISNLKQHFSHKHKPRPPTFPCVSPGCKLVFHSLSSLKNHETTHANMIYNCNLCDKHMFSKSAINKHMIIMHKAIYQSGASKSALWSEVDLTNYNIKNCQGTACPKCNVKYPNLRALKIHYFKFHDKT